MNDYTIELLKLVLYVAAFIVGAALFFVSDSLLSLAGLLLAVAAFFAIALQIDYLKDF